MVNSGIIATYGGVDWLTVTGARSKAWERVQDYCLSFHQDLIAAGERSRQVNAHGYKMTAIGGLSYGEGNQGWMVRVHGELARKYWAVLALYGTNYSRVDLMMTVFYETDQADTAEVMYHEACRVGGPVAEKRLLLLLNPTRGSSLYYGSRSSAQYGRFYDKYRQQKKAVEWKNALRWEVEFKKPLSQKVVEQLLAEHPTDAEIATMVGNWFQARAIPVPKICTNGDNEIQLPSNRTTVERRLDWLKKSVRPAFQQLVLSGWGSEAEEALGLIKKNVPHPERGTSNGSG